MITVSEATRIIFDHHSDPDTEVVSISDACGRVLAENVEADRDLPPFNRVSMDGIAIDHRQWASGRRTFAIEGIQAAGEPQKGLTHSMNCIEVMTGATLPSGCDTVIRYEDIEIADGNAVVVAEVVNKGQSLHLQGMDAKKGELLLAEGQRIASSEVALLASVGKSRVRVFSFPRIAIISTGDELVAVDQSPAPWQIRRSNTYSLLAAIREMGGDATCFHLQDEASGMETALKKIIADFQVLILSGGVSKGKFDFVPQVLEAIGIRKLFHEVSQRPGKPFWFGASPSGRVAFALPGNPVSTFMCFYRYVRPWILRTMRTAVVETTATLARDYTFAPRLTCFLQVSAINEQGRMMAYPVPGGGSGDFANLKNVTGFLELPLEKTEFKAGEVFSYVGFRH